MDKRNASANDDGPNLLASAAAFLLGVQSAMRGRQMSRTPLRRTRASYLAREMPGGDVTRGLRDPVRPF